MSRNFSIDSVVKSIQKEFFLDTGKSPGCLINFIVYIRWVLRKQTTDAGGRVGVCLKGRMVVEVEVSVEEEEEEGVEEGYGVLIMVYGNEWVKIGVGRGSFGGR